MSSFREREAHVTKADSVVLIPLTKGYLAVVDAFDSSVAEHKWSACVRGSGKNVRVYATREENGKRILLHHAIFGRPDGLDVDHIDGNTLNCCRSNLRSATRSQNNANGRKRAQTTSKFKGVHFHEQCRKWTAQIRKRHLGLFRDEFDAATAYNFAATEDYGEFARLNLP